MREYLNQYIPVGDEEIRFFTWVKSQGISLADAKQAIEIFQSEKVTFETPYAFSQAVVKRAQQCEIENLLNYKIEATIEGIVAQTEKGLWLSIRVLWLRAVTGITRLLNLIFG